METMIPESGKINLKSRDTIFLDNNISMLYIVKGFVDIFAVKYENNIPTGKLNAICRVNEGHAFFSWNSGHRDMQAKELPVKNNIRVIGIAGENSELEAINESEISKRLMNKESKVEITGHIKYWIETLINGITSHNNATPGSKSIFKTIPVSLESRNRISSDELLWIEQGSTAELTDEATSLKVLHNTWIMPLYRKRQLICSKPGTINAYDTTHALEKHGFNLLRAFHDNFLNNLETLAQDVIFYTAEQVIRNMQQKEESINTAKQHAASIMQPEDVLAIQTPADFGWDYYVRDSVEIILKTMNLKLKFTEKYVDNYDTIVDYLKDISSENNVQTRRITLNEGWWKHDGMSFIGFFKDTNSACAVISHFDHYVLVNPADKSKTIIDFNIADKLHKEGYTFYPVLPDEPVKLKDMIKLALNSNMKNMALIMTISVIVSILGLATPIKTHNIIDPGIVYSNTKLVMQLTIALIVVSFSILIFNLIRDFSIVRLQAKADIGLQSAIIDRLFRLPLSFFRKYSAGDLASRTLGTEQIQRQLTGANMNAILGGIFSVVNLITMFYYAAPLAGVALILIVISSAIGVALSINQYKYIKKSLDLGGAAGGVAFQLCNGLPKIKIMDKEEQGMLQWSSIFSSFGSLSYKAKQLNRTLLVTNSGMQLAAQIVILGSISWIMKGKLDVGNFVAFLAAFAQFSMGMASFASIVSYILPVQALYGRLKPILMEEPELISNRTVIQGELKGKISARNIYFRYNPDTPYVLNSISFDIAQGEFTAFVGPSGAGKSTLFKILLGLEAIDNGAIFFDDYDISGLNLRDLRRKIGVVSQKSQLVPGNIFENIVGSGSYSMEEAWEAARQAGIDKDIESFPMGMYTVVSEDSGTFSGGQKQRILIARALIRKPKIILFDEATSSLDNKTQEIVAQSLDKIKATRVVIAHRLSTIMRADTIHVIDKGKIVESGNYKKLMEKQGYFYRLALRQIV